MCVCLCVCVYMCVHVCVCVCVHVRVCAYACVCAYIVKQHSAVLCVCVYTYVCVCVWVYMLIRRSPSQFPKSQPWLLGTFFLPKEFLISRATCTLIHTHIHIYTHTHTVHSYTHTVEKSGLTFDILFAHRISQQLSCLLRIFDQLNMLRISVTTEPTFQNFWLLRMYRQLSMYGVATISRLLKIIRLFCRISSLL